MCKTFIPPTARSINCLRVGNEVSRVVCPSLNRKLCFWKKCFVRKRKTDEIVYMTFKWSESLYFSRVFCVGGWVLPLLSVSTPFSLFSRLLLFMKCLWFWNSAWQVRPFCSSRCCADYNRVIQLCATCHTDISKSSISFSSPVGSDKTFKDFCSQGCFKKYEDLLSTDVEIIRVEPGKTKKMGKCNVCQKVSVQGSGCDGCWYLYFGVIRGYIILKFYFRKFYVSRLSNV